MKLVLVALLLALTVCATALGEVQDQSSSMEYTFYQATNSDFQQDVV